jgi:hypothetical protein
VVVTHDKGVRVLLYAFQLRVIERQVLVCVSSNDPGDLPCTEAKRGHETCASKRRQNHESNNRAKLGHQSARQRIGDRPARVARRERCKSAGRSRDARSARHGPASSFSTGPCAHEPPGRLARVAFRGCLSTAMIYDRQPIVDHVRRNDGDRELGPMRARSAATCKTSPNTPDPSPT